MTNQSISLTAAAAGRVRTFLDRDGGVGLRVGVRKTGCSGWAYVVALAEQVTEQDEVFECQGVKIVVERDALPMLAGSTIDYVSQGLNQSFEFRNPNVTDECGCGESFAVASSG